MIPAGTCFCHRCGSLFKEAYYKSGMQPVGVILKHSVVRFGRKKWKIEAFRPDGGEIKESPELLPVGVEQDGMPDFIRCKFGEDEFELKRSCPKCENDTELSKDNGRHPTYVVAMVGATQTGKSAWLKAIATKPNLYAVNQIEKYPCEIDFWKKYDLEDWDLKATVPGAAGETNYLRIKEKGSGEIIANVLFLDSAGELFRKIAQDEVLLKRLLLGDGEYTGVDGLVYIESAEWSTNPTRTQEDIARRKASFETYQQMDEIGALENKPIAFVYTHTDLMLKKKDRIPKVADMSGARNVPVCNETTFKGKTSYEQKDLLIRLLQEDWIARQINQTVLMDTATNRQGFMIQTCSRVDDNSPWNNYGENFNVMDPLLWILNALRLFPIN